MMKDELNCAHCGEPVDPAEAEGGQCPACGEPIGESSVPPDMGETSDVKPTRKEPRGLSIGPFLIGLGILLATIAVLCVKCRFKDYSGVIAVVGLGGLSLIVIGIVYGSVCVWLTLRRRGGRALWALATLVLLISSAALIAAMGLAPPLAVYASTFGSPRLMCEPSQPAQERLEAYAAIDDIAWGVHRLKRDIPADAFFAADDTQPGNRVDYLYGNTGELPQFSDEARESWGTGSENMRFVLVTNGKTEPRFRYKVAGWDGAYLRREVGADPWGFAYLVSVNGFEGGTKPDNNAWCLSAGPNHIVDTPADAAELRGDDLGHHLDEMPYLSSRYTCSPEGCAPKKD